MENNHNNLETNYSWYYILGAIFGILTAWIISESVIWTLSGAIIGLVFAAFFVNTLVRDREV